MSFAEFTYPLMQGWDWWHMYSSVGVQMQIGGSDQFGNILTGVEDGQDGAGVGRSAAPAVARRLGKRPSRLHCPAADGLVGGQVRQERGERRLAGPVRDDRLRPLRLLRAEARRRRRAAPEAAYLLTAGRHRGRDGAASPRPAQAIAQHALALEVLSLVHGPGVAAREQQQHQMMFGKGRRRNPRRNATPRREHRRPVGVRGRRRPPHGAQQRAQDRDAAAAVTRHGQVDRQDPPRRRAGVERQRRQSHRRRQGRLRGGRAGSAQAEPDARQPRLDARHDLVPRRDRELPHRRPHPDPAQGQAQRPRHRGGRRRGLEGLGPDVPRRARPPARSAR